MRASWVADKGVTDPSAGKVPSAWRGCMAAAAHWLPLSRSEWRRWLSQLTPQRTPPGLRCTCMKCKPLFRHMHTRAYFVQLHGHQRPGRTARGFRRPGASGTQSHPQSTGADPARSSAQTCNPSDRGGGHKRRTGLSALHRMHVPRGSMNSHICRAVLTHLTKRLPCRKRTITSGCQCSGLAQ